MIVYIMYHSVEAVLSMNHSFLRKVNCFSHGLTCILLTTCMDVCPVLLLPSYLVIRAHVQQDGEALLGRHPPAGCVQCQLANWDAHPIAAQVSQPQDPLPIRHTDSLWRNTSREPQNHSHLLLPLCVAGSDLNQQIRSTPNRNMLFFFLRLGQVLHPPDFPLTSHFIVWRKTNSSWSTPTAWNKSVA